MPLNPELSSLGSSAKVILLGSGGLSIGQAGEFDYSGTQAIRAIVEQGIEVVVVNPNIATVQTDPIPGIRVYLYPVEPEWIEKVIVQERPNGIVAGFGGQTALNCLIDLEKQGVLEKYGVSNLGTPASVLELTEDRDEFANKMKSIGMPVPPSIACESVDEALSAAKSIGYPVILRAAFALGGLGSGFANSDEELVELATGALASSSQVLIEKSLKGWKEVEYEVMRDSAGNTITICNMENFDPLGIHTGDSIVVAPSQTLSDAEYQILRDAAIKIISELGVVGECNVQYALDPESTDFFVIEVNARLSRSSALASKATGYPIAYIAAKVVLGYDLLELKNPVTGITYAFFEPALDYLAIKFPRWDLTKFQGVKRQLGSTMKSVGEVMAIGRNFPEAMQKAVRMVSEDGVGLSRLAVKGGEKPRLTAEDIETELAFPTDRRVYAVLEAFRQGYTLERIAELSDIDKWFLSHLQYVYQLEYSWTQMSKGVSAADPEKLIQLVSAKQTQDDWRRFKVAGFGDEQLAALALVAAFPDRQFSSLRVQEASLQIRKARLDRGVKPVIKKIDTTAGEYPTPSNYLYMSYAGLFDDRFEEEPSAFAAVVLGGGSYRIGTSVEFDWCAVSCSKRLRQAGWRSIIINCNPETVSTDYNSSDHLYFEELTLERILDIYAYERPVGVITSMGGQLPNKLALPLASAGVKLLGHKPASIDSAEDRLKFSSLLDRLDIDQPRWTSATSEMELKKFVDLVGYPVLIRPSYVLSGAAMEVAFDADSLARCLKEAVTVSPDHPIVISEFIQGAREIELDGVAKNGQILTAIVSEHIENAGVHSGDATTVVPAQRLYVETVRQVRRAGRGIARELQLNGPFNMQFLAKSGKIKVIECNARAARSFPFVSKTVGLNLADAATDIIIGMEPNLSRFSEDDLPYVGVKAAMFSFKRLGGADPMLRVEMASTGEVGCIAENFSDALILSLMASGIRIPRKGVLVSSGTEKEKLAFLEAAQIFKQKEIPIYATEGSYQHLVTHGLNAILAGWPDQGQEKDLPDAVSLIKSGEVDLVVNIPKNSAGEELQRGVKIRQASVRFGASLITNMEKTVSLARAMLTHENFLEEHKLLSLPKYR